ncbi:MAG: 5'-nucleotidase [Candidatus Riflebacteria bacterium HGW-Riflebacteria-1]|jgi:5'-nucleotidase|nr:MAG: 5'-nucleotidase [Candidatus Riflebacteria bacterium HGW-Riflebacteria-1]
MPFEIKDKLVIAVASSALFDLSESDRVFQEKGCDAYHRYQRQKQNVALKQGVAFPFVRRLLNINKRFAGRQPIEVVLLSKNDPDTGLRVFNSIQHYGLEIIRAGFLNGKSPIKYIPAFNAALFLSANAADVKEAINAGFPAGTVLGSPLEDDPDDNELRIAFDFDGVIVDDEAEKVYQTTRNIDRFHESETQNAALPMDPGPLFKLFRHLSVVQKFDRLQERRDKNYKRFLRISIVTARSAPAHERAINTLRKWKIFVDEAFFLGGIEKRRILEVMHPHIFFDDQMVHLKSSSGKHIPSVHIPFGITNRT